MGVCWPCGGSVGLVGGPVGLAGCHEVYEKVHVGQVAGSHGPCWWSMGLLGGP